ncbi:transglycosylase SLT domain-containing protein [Ottowia thiooxydans]|uniref:transglycosylase SLT domain-containing protein n=1 Tax=Ottowia thiooxydans TaxID=219182 RepID=UPI000491BB70|nr:transglycosylase SLT domain-containing protein [Ottowia thiooxydans]
MKWFHVAALAASVWLAGCAAPVSNPEPDSAAGTPTASNPTASATPSATRPPVVMRRQAPLAGDMPPVPVRELHSSAVAELDTPVDLWERIRRGFAMPDLDTDLVRDREQYYITRPDYLQRMTERSRMYLFHIVEELELRGMPTELALLPYIESAFNPQAVSSAKAAGMWQFMPATGRDFDLKQNIFRDDRRDVLGSTRAALDYLQKLYNMFGDWHLALAAYNWGEGSVGRAIARNKAAGLGTGYLDLKMPNETRYYVPKLQAVKNIVARPQALGTVLPLIENHPFFDTVDITRDIDIEVAARLAEVRVEDFRALNPSQRKPIIFATGTPQVLLPWDNAATFKRNLASYDPGKLASWTAWVAPANIASREAARRVGMEESDFRSVNAIPAGMMVKAGSTLLVPRTNDSQQAVPSHVLNNAQVAYAPEVVLKRFAVRARKGDSIAKLASRYDLPAATVAGWNNTNAGAGLKAGQTVTVFLPVRAGASAAADAARHVRKTSGTSRAKAAPSARARSTSKASTSPRSSKASSSTRKKK